MATQQDLQELIRLLTVTRKMPMIQAMGQIKALQAVELKSIKDIADAELSVVQSAVKDEKQARALQSACKAMLKRGSSAGSKRDAPSASESSASKRSKVSSDTNDLLPGLSQQDQLSPQELEASLALPVNLDEDLISRTVLQTNRAPLVLAFAVELLRYTNPEQPPSSRLSLAQAVVSANSRSKAVSLGIEKGAPAEDEGWGTGQPKVRIMGRDVAVLKRGGYEWKGEEEVGTDDAASEPKTEEPLPPPKTHPFFLPQPKPEPAPSSPIWSTSPPLSLKSSTFVARATTITSPSQRQSLLTSLMTSIPHLKTATHNAWAYRTTSNTGYVSEQSEDDGETGAGALLLRVMRDLGATDTLVVMTRWYGGIMLGPDRWRLMRNVVTAALTERLRKTGAEVVVGGEAVWGLDLEGTKGRASGGGGGRQTGSSVVGMQIHSPQGARSYLLKSFGGAPSEEKADDGGEGSPSKKKVVKRTLKDLDREKEENLGLLLGALRLLYDSWADHLSPADLDRRAWSWYVAVRPEVDVGPSGWGAKGLLKLEDILKLRRKENT
ncbi:hypothetical protein CONLIGDRAFT_78942 [Coniochaeta ligniaria NRRL 30616]|uniref:Impact N-terminal domain-containing protein n=1 Tax=Coniochaeta ligniaria NRRL 30616 TaxID=1408157 RepID=A0A1J7J5D8_9PEZI|nr:hypothetical protein CONLIGDRAFT_78942 [Coniochaeta ligniaria NRRL 30616]